MDKKEHTLNKLKLVLSGENDAKTIKIEDLK